MITLCGDGRYFTTGAFGAASDASGLSVNQIGIACCEPFERGTYELERNGTAVRFSPSWSRDGKPTPHTGSIEGDMLNGFVLARPMPCD